MDRLAEGRLLVEQGQQFAELARAVLEAHHAAHLAIVDVEASQQIHGAVALVLELAPRRSIWRWCWSAAVGWRTPMPGFSSTQNSGPSVGGLSSNSMTATALVAGVRFYKRLKDKIAARSEFQLAA